MEMLIAAAIGTIVFASVAQLLLSQNLSAFKLRAKLELTGVHLDIQQALSDPATCMANFGNLRIDENQAGSASYALPVNSLVDDALMPNTILQQGQSPNGFSSNARVSEIRVTNIVKVSDDQFRFDVKIPLVNRDNFVTKMIGVTGMWMTTEPSSPASAKIPQDCGYGARAVGVGTCRLIEAFSDMNGPGDAFCAPGEKLVTGGGSCVRMDTTAWDESGPSTEVGWLVGSTRISSGALEGWRSDCYGLNLDMSKSQVVAYCCVR